MIFTPTTLATKPDLNIPVPTEKDDLNIGTQLLQMLLVLGFVVIGIKVFLPKILTKLNPDIKGSGIAALEIEETAVFGTGKLFVVRIHGKRLLLSSGPQGVNCLADLTPSTPIHEPAAFFEMLDHAQEKAPTEPLQSAPISTEVESPLTPELERLSKNVDRSDIQSALDRISRFTGS